MFSGASAGGLLGLLGNPAELMSIIPQMISSEAQGLVCGAVGNVYGTAMGEIAQVQNLALWPVNEASSTVGGAAGGISGIAGGATSGIPTIPVPNVTQPPTIF